jgi:hypothetical protein
MAFSPMLQANVDDISDSFLVESKRNTCIPVNALGGIPAIQVIQSRWYEHESYHMVKAKKRACRSRQSFRVVHSPTLG